MASDDIIKEKRARLLKSCDAYSAPDFDLITLSNPNYESLFASSLSYATYMFELDQIKSFAEEYVGYPLKGIPSYEFMHIGIMCWLLNNAAELHEEKITSLNKRIKDLQSQYTEIQSEEKIVVTLKDRRTKDVIYEIDEMLDHSIYGNNDFDFNSFKIKLNENIDKDKIKTYYSNQLNDLENPECAEGFEKWTAKDRKRIIELFKEVVEGLSSKNIGKKTRRVNKPRKINPGKMVRKVKYLKKDDTLGLISIDPVKAVAKEVIWVYNVKTRKLGKYVAKDVTGLLFKGSSITNFNEYTSIAKTLRKPKEVLDKLSIEGKVFQKTLLDGIKAKEIHLNGRLNKDTIIVKVF